MLETIIDVSQKYNSQNSKILNTNCLESSIKTLLSRFVSNVYIYSPFHLVLVSLYLCCLKHAHHLHPPEPVYMGTEIRS